MINPTILLERNDKVGPIFLPVFLAERFNLLQSPLPFLDQVLRGLAHLIRRWRFGILGVVDCQLAFLNHLLKRLQDEVSDIIVHDGQLWVVRSVMAMIRGRSPARVQLMVGVILLCRMSGNVYCEAITPVKLETTDATWVG
jgi:hypothetical protein